MGRGFIMFWRSSGGEYFEDEDEDEDEDEGGADGCLTLSLVSNWREAE